MKRPWDTEKWESPAILSCASPPLIQLQPPPETLSREHTAKSFLNSRPTETERKNIFLKLEWFFFLYSHGITRRDKNNKTYWSKLENTRKSIHYFQNWLIKKAESSIYSAFLIWAIYPDTQIVYDGQFPSIDVFLLRAEKEWSNELIEWMTPKWINRCKR